MAGLFVWDIALNDDEFEPVIVANPWLLLPLESNKDSRFIPDWGVVVIIVDDIGRIDLWWKWDGGKRRREWKETKYLSSLLSAMSKTENPSVHHSVKIFLSISCLCMCQRGRWWHRFCSGRRWWGWGRKCIIHCKAGGLPEERELRGRTIGNNNLTMLDNINSRDLLEIKW